MARIEEVLVTKLDKRNTLSVYDTETTLTSAIGTTAKGIPWTDRDDKFLLVLSPDGATATVTIAKGDSIQSTKDLVLTITTANRKYALTLDSMRYKITTGDDKGLIKISSTAAAKCEVYKLP